MTAKRLRVAVRVRALSPQGPSQAGPTLVGNYGHFTVDSVDEDGTQESFYADCAAVHTGSLLQGLNSVVLAYGASGSGKSYTIQGAPFQSSEADAGILPQAVADIFSQLSAVPSHRYKLLISACGLSAGADTCMIDLLAANTILASFKDGSGVCAWGKAARQALMEPEDIYKVLTIVRVAVSKHTRPLHVCFTLQLVGFVASGEELSSSISFIELLAPDARDALGRPTSQDPSLSRSLALGYTTLNTVLAMLRQGSGGGGTGSGSGGGPNRVVPWRNAPLTRWLQHVLTRADEVLVIGTVSPAPQSAPDTLATLSYVSKLRPAGLRDGVIVTASWETPGTGQLYQGTERAAKLTRPAEGAAAKRQAHAARRHITHKPGFSLLAVTPTSANVSGAEHSVSGSVPTPPTEPFTQHPSPAFTFDTPASHQTLRSQHSAPEPVAANSPQQHKDTATAVAAPLVAVAAARAGSPVRAAAAARSPVSPRSPAKASRQAPVESGATFAPEATLARSPSKRGLTTPVATVSAPCSPKSAALQGSFTADALVSASRLPASPGTALLERVILGLQQQLEAAHAQMARYEAERGTFTQEIQRLAELSIGATKELEWQARESSLEREVAVLRDKLSARDAAVTGLTVQLADCRVELTEARAAKDKAELQLQGAVDGLRGQVQSLTEETQRLKRRAQDAVADSDRDAASRRALEAQVAALHAQLSGRSDATEAAQRQLEALHTQLREANLLLEEARADRTKAQESKWQSEERVQQLATELEAARTAQLQLQRELLAGEAEARGEVRAASDQAAVLQAELSRVTNMYTSLKDKVAKLEQTIEQQKQSETFTGQEVTEAEAMLREFERDLEVHAASIYRALRHERSDIPAASPGQSHASLAARWRPVLHALVAALRKQCVDQGYAEEALGVLKSQLQLTASKAVHVDELAATLRAQQEAYTQALEENSNLQAQLQHSSEQIEALQRERDTLEAAYRDVQASLNHIRNELSTVQEEYNSVSHTAAQAATTLPTLQHKVQTRGQLISLLWIELSHILSSLTAMRHTLETPSHSHTTTTTTHTTTTTTPYNSSLTQAASYNNNNSTPVATLKTSQMDAASPRQLFLTPQAGQGGLAGEGGSVGVGVGVVRTVPSKGVGGRGFEGVVVGLNQPLDLDSSDTQQRVLHAMSQARVQVSALIARLTHCQDSLGTQTHSLNTAHKEGQELKQRLEEAEEQLADVKQRLSSLQTSHASLGTLQQETLAAKTQAEAQVSELSSKLATANTLERDLSETRLQRDKYKAQDEALLAELATLRNEASLALSTSAADTRAKQLAESEVTALTAKVTQQEGVINDLKQQLGTVSARLSATERALMDASGRVSELNSKLALTETDSRIKVQELTTKLTTAESAVRVAETLHTETQERLTQTIKMLEGQLEATKSELQTVHDERHKALQQIDMTERQLRDMQVQAQDAAYAHKQLRSVLDERDSLDVQLRQLRSSQHMASVSASHELATLRQELDAVKTDLQQTAADRLQLAAQLEVAKLGNAVKNALGRSRPVTASTNSPSIPSHHHAPSIPRNPLPKPTTTIITSTPFALPHSDIYPADQLATPKHALASATAGYTLRTETDRTPYHRGSLTAVRAPYNADSPTTGAGPVPDYVALARKVSSASKVGLPGMLQGGGLSQPFKFKSSQADVDLGIDLIDLGTAGSGRGPVVVSQEGGLMPGVNMAARTPANSVHYSPAKY